MDITCDKACQVKLIMNVYLHHVGIFPFLHNIMQWIFCESFVLNLWQWTGMLDNNIRLQVCVVFVCAGGDWGEAKNDF